MAWRLLPRDTLLCAEEAAQPQVPQPKRGSSDTFPSPSTDTSRSHKGARPQALPSTRTEALKLLSQ